MNRKLVVSILAIILVIAMVFSLLLSVIPVGRADSYDAQEYTAEAYSESITQYC